MTWLLSIKKRLLEHLVETELFIDDPSGTACRLLRASFSAGFPLGFPVGFLERFLDWLSLSSRCVFGTNQVGLAGEWARFGLPGLGGLFAL